MRTWFLSRQVAVNCAEYRKPPGLRGRHEESGPGQRWCLLERLNRSGASGTRASAKLYRIAPAEHNSGATRTSPNLHGVRPEMQTEMLDFPTSPGEAVWSDLAMRRSDLVQHKEKEKGTVSRTSQIVFGERQHLLRVLDSLEGTDLPIAPSRCGTSWPSIPTHRHRCSGGYATA